MSLGPEPAGPLIFIGVAHLDRALAEGDLGHQRLDWRPYFVPRGEETSHFFSITVVAE